MRRLLSTVFFLVCLTALLFPQDIIVYVTATGQMYHNDGCTSLRRSRIPVLLIDAVRSGHRPCTHCSPPVLTEIPHRVSNTIYRVNEAGLASSGDACINLMLPADVVGHIDGDTVRVRIPNPPVGLSVIETIRLLGVDTPETVHPNRAVEHFGQEASDFTRAKLYGQTVFLAFDWDLRDRFGRLLTYIYTNDGLCFNAVLISEGYGQALTRFPFQFLDEFLTLEHEARYASRGLWASGN